jgi:carnosine N-methyltransferase
VTCFFIDTARNVLNYLKIIHALLEDNGVWINIGECKMNDTAGP